MPLPDDIKATLQLALVLVLLLVVTTHVRAIAWQRELFYNEITNGMGRGIPQRMSFLGGDLMMSSVPEAEPCIISAVRMAPMFQKITDDQRNLMGIPGPMCIIPADTAFASGGRVVDKCVANDSSPLFDRSVTADVKLISNPDGAESNRQVCAVLFHNNIPPGALEKYSTSNDEEAQRELLVSANDVLNGDKKLLQRDKEALRKAKEKAEADKAAVTAELSATIRNLQLDISRREAAMFALQRAQSDLQSKLLTQSRERETEVRQLRQQLDEANGRASNAQAAAAAASAAAAAAAQPQAPVPSTHDFRGGFVGPLAIDSAAAVRSQAAYAQSKAAYNQSALYTPAAALRSWPSTGCHVQNMTILFWILIVRVDAMWNNIVHVTQGLDAWGGGTRRPAFWIIPNTTRLHLCFDTTAGGNNWYNTSNSIPIGVPTMVAVTVNGMTPSVNIMSERGSHKEQWSFNGTPLQADTHWSVYANSWFPYYQLNATFKLQNLRFYNRALTDSEVDTVYKAGRS